MSDRDIDQVADAAAERPIICPYCGMHTWLDDHCALPGCEGHRVADAAADGLREQLARVIHDHVCGSEDGTDCAWFVENDSGGRCDLTNLYGFADAVLPVVVAHAAAERVQLTVKIRKQADRYFTPRCDQDDRTYGHGLRYAAHLIEEEGEP